MNDREFRRYDMFQRVLTFGRDHAAEFPPASRVFAHTTALQQVVLELEGAKASQIRGRTTAREVLLDALRLDLQNVTRTARAIEQDEPGFADRFRLTDTPGHSSLLTAAAAMIAELGKPGVAEKFAAHELPGDLAKAISDDVAAIHAAKTQETSQGALAVSSTAAIGERIRAGMKEVTYLDAIMHNKYARNAETLRAWSSVSHVERIGHREKAAAPATPAPVAAAAATTAVKVETVGA
jgi:hypothetical protein